MRHLLLLGTLLSLSASAQLSNGLVGYWKLNGDLLDVSGNGLHATTNLPLSPTMNRSGGEGCALYGYDFDVNTPISSLFVHDPNGAFSFSIWMKRQNDQASFGMRGGIWPWVAQGWEFVINTTDGLSFGNYNQPQLLHADSTLIAFDTAWHHYVGIYDDHDWSIYYDGQLLLQDNTTTADVGTGTGNVQANVAGGDIDDYRYYGRALLPNEIDSLFNEQPDCASSTSISEAGSLDITLGPNPTDGVIELYSDEAFRTGTMLRLTDAMGRLVLERPIAGTRTTIDLSDQPSGIYQLSVISVVGSRTMRIVRE